MIQRKKAFRSEPGGKEQQYAEQQNGDRVRECQCAGQNCGLFESRAGTHEGEGKQGFAMARFETVQCAEAERGENR